MHQALAIVCLEVLALNIKGTHTPKMR